MSARAPTSTPRNGSSSRTRRTLPSNQRPTITFCWLPPDRSVRSASMPGPTTPKSSTARRALRRSARLDSRAARLCWRRRGKGHVVSNRPARDHGRRAALLGDERHPGANGLGGTRGTIGTPVEGQLAADQRPGAVELLQQLGLSRPDEAGEPDDLTRPDVEVERQRVRPGPHAAGRQDDGRSRPGLVVQRGATARASPAPVRGPGTGASGSRVTTPSRSTTTRSDTSSISTRSCETNSTATPLARERRTEAAGVPSRATTGSTSARRGRAP